MPSRRALALLALLAFSVALVPSLSACGSRERATLPRSQTWAELRAIRRAVVVTPPDEGARAPYRRERLVDGEHVRVEPEGLAWLRRDGGATLLVRGPADLTVRSDAIELALGSVFIDTPSGAPTELATPAGPLHLAHVRASVEVQKAGTEVYVLAGEVRTDGAAHAAAGERLTMTGAGKEMKATTAPVVAWDDWTGGLATTDRVAEPSPFGVGTVGARRPGDTGAPGFPLAIQRLDVRVTVDRDFAVTEVDELFFNPSSEVVEGVYRFRTPEGATMHRFGVDRDGVVVWGHVKEKAAAAAQSQANVYQGSTEDPALLEWDAPGVYRARLYPIGPGETRRVVVRYAEWLGRSGKKHERRLYVYPMAAEGAEESLPHVEDLYATIDLAHAGAKEVRAGMAGVRDGDTLVVREHDLVPRADLAVELFDDGLTRWRGYTAPHAVDTESLPPAERAEALKRARTEADYVLVPVPDEAGPEEKSGLDLAIVVDTSAATETAALAVARAATGALLAHLGKDDRAVVWAGDAVLRPVVPGKEKLAALDEAGRREVLARLAGIERGGATDLGAMLTEAAATLDPTPGRRGAVVYIGDGAATVGELGLVNLRARLSKLPRPVRIFGLGVGDGADMAILEGLARGAFAERIGDGNGAARAALRLLEIAERPARLGASVDLGPTVERVYPRDLGAIVEGEGQVVVGRLAGAQPATMTVKTAAGETKVPLEVGSIDDGGDLGRRWAGKRLGQMLAEGVGRAAMVDLGSRHGIITPVTSLYVPTKNEMSPDERADLEKKKAEHHEALAGRFEGFGRSLESEEQEHAKVFFKRDEVANNNADNKEGGTGTRAKGEEGSMGNPNGRIPGMRFGVRGPADNPRAQTGSPAPTTVDIPAWGAAPTPEASAAATAGPMNGQAKLAEAAEQDIKAKQPDTAPRLARAEAPTDRPAGKGGQAVGGKVIVEDKKVMPFQGGVAGGPTPIVAKNAPVGGAQALHGGDDADAYRTALQASTTLLGSNDANADGSLNQGFVSGLGGALSGATAPANELLAVEGFDAKPSPAHYKANAIATKELSKTANDRWWNAAGGYFPELTLRIGEVPHAALRCGGAAFLPLEERVALWRERLGRVTGDAWGVASVYRRALAACEAPTWRERSRLHGLLLDAMPGVGGKVSLWRTLFADAGAADALYRGMLARARTPEEVRQLHDALGLKSIDPGVLAKLIKDARTPAERATKLRGLVAVWPDDFALALKLLDALEDAGDDGGARELGRRLRARPDADARVRTAVGELYLRLAARAKDAPARARDEGEARRAFGEIVEFAPDDPIARRRIGDLLRAHGWYEDAARQYETLARLTPDDASVPLLLAAAAQGTGKLEEAVKWTEKSGAAGSPDADQSPARTARAFAATYLAWGRLDALAAGRAEEANALAARLARVRSAERAAPEALRGTRVTLTWAHPELHPALWTNALGAAMPAPEGDVTLGIAAATVPVTTGGGGGAWVEVRLEGDEVEHAARLGAEAVLTTVFDEGSEGEKIVRTKVHFSGTNRGVTRFSLAAGAVKEVSP